MHVCGLMIEASRLYVRVKCTEKMKVSFFMYEHIKISGTRVQNYRTAGNIGGLAPNNVFHTIKFFGL